MQEGFFFFLNPAGGMKQNITIESEKVLSDEKYSLKKYTFRYPGKNGDLQTQEREIYDTGNAATILLYNEEKKTVILTRQFRPPSFLNGNESGYLVETNAGQLDADSPEACIRRESEEETGYRLQEVRFLFSAYMTPGAVTELLYFFVAPYHDSMRIAEGGGLAEEGENIRVMEVPFEEALRMISSGEIKDAKTIMLLQYARMHQLL